MDELKNPLISPLRTSTCHPSTTSPMMTAKLGHGNVTQSVDQLPQDRDLVVRLYFINRSLMVFKITFLNFLCFIFLNCSFSSLSILAVFYSQYEFFTICRNWSFFIIIFFYVLISQLTLHVLGRNCSFSSFNFDSVFYSQCEFFTIYLSFFTFATFIPDSVHLPG